MVAYNKIKIVIFNSALVATLSFCMHAQADLLDTLKSATDVIKRTGVLDSSDNSTSSNSEPMLSGNSSTPMANAELPMGLVEYPNAELERRIDNPYAKTVTPISLPKLQSFKADYNLYAEGKVTMLQFMHKTDDSPLLIQQHYEAWLASNGFERLLVCAAPCKKAKSSMYWMPSIDPDSRLDSNHFPHDQTVVVGLKSNAVVFVAVGRDNYGNTVMPYTSFVKVIDGRVTDNSAWKKLTTPATLPPPVEPSQPAAGAPSMSGVQAISAENALKYVREAKGVTFVQVSSYDRNCGYCIRGNPGYEDLSKRYAGKAVFLQITAQPWPDALKNEFARSYGISSVPATLVFRDGQLKRQHVGAATADELDQKLVK